MDSPPTRLLTLVGEGGVGKSALAVTAGWASLEQWDGHVFSVPLVDVDPAPADTLRQRIIGAVAQAVGLVFSTPAGGNDVADQLFPALARMSTDEAPLLLILDNFEHLIQAAPLLDEIRQALPHCRLLVTSRQPLQLPGEVVVRLDGLSVPPQTAVLPLPDSAYASVDLFVQRARQRQHTFQITSDNRQALGHLCRLLAGNALGLELAAAWVEHFSVAEMVAELETHMVDFLHSPHGNVPERHRSLRRVMETSWRLISAQAQTVLAQLSVFRGSFHREPALEITGATLPLLVELVNASLLQQREPGRYELHEMVRQFAAERLHSQPHTGRQSFQRHAAYYLTLLGGLKIFAHESPTRLSEEIGQMAREMPNIRQAWKWASRPDRVDDHYQELGKASPGLWRYFLQSGLFEEAEDLLGQGVDALAHSLQTTTVEAGPPGRRLALARLQVALAACLNVRGRYAQASSVAESAVNYALQEENEPLIARGYLQWGTAHYRQGRYAEAVVQLQMALMAAQDANLPLDEADVLHLLSGAMVEQGDFDQSIASAERALGIEQQVGNRLGEGNSLNQLGWIHQRLQRYEESRHYFQRAYEVHASIDNHHGTNMALINLSVVQQQVGDFYGAFESYHQLLRKLERLPDPYQRSLANNGLGVVLLRIGDYPAARHHLMTSLEIDRFLGDPGGESWNYNALGMLATQGGQAKTGLAYHNQALAISRKQGARTVEGIALLGIGQDYQALGAWAQAQAAYEQAIQVQAGLQQTVRVMESRSGLGVTLLAQGQEAGALGQVEQIIDFLAEHTLQGAAQPSLLYWNCYEVLQTAEDVRATEMLSQALDLIRQRGDKIRDPRLRRCYLYAIPVHRQILDEAEKMGVSGEMGRLNDWESRRLGE